MSHAASRIDMHTHILPPPLLAAAREHGGIGGGWAGPLPSVDDLLAAMDAYDISASVLSMPVSLSFGGRFAIGGVRTLARACNDHYAALLERAPSRLAAIGCLPLPDVNASLEEIEYIFDVLHFDGIVLLSNYDGVYVGDSGFDAVFEELERRRAYVLVHPVATADPLGQFFGTFLLELPFDTTRAVMNLLFSGTLARFPGVRLQFAHMGGTAPYLAPRVEEVFSRYPDAEQVAPSGLDHLRRLYWDTALAAGAAPLRAALALTDVDHIVFGTDWPFDTARPSEGPDPAPGLRSLGAERHRVERLNSLALVPRLADN